MRKKIITAVLAILAALSFSSCQKNPTIDENSAETFPSAATQPCDTEFRENPDEKPNEIPDGIPQALSGFERTESGGFRIVTNNDPENFAEITIDGFEVSVKAKYNDGEVWAANGHRLNARGEVRFKEKAENGELTAIYLYWKNGPKKGSYYCTVVYVYADENGLYPPDSSENAERNSLVSETVTELPEMGVEAYIDAGLDEQTIIQTLDKVKALGDEICAGLSDDYDKLRAITIWVRDNIYYDFDACETEVTPETVCLSRVLELRRSVCGGYANLVAALCASQGITCYNLRGTAESSGLPFGSSAANPELHEWNLAVIDGRKIWVDAGFCTTNAYRGGEYVDGYRSLDYFDITDDLFAVDHRADYCEFRDYKAYFSKEQPL